MLRFSCTLLLWWNPSQDHRLAAHLHCGLLFYGATATTAPSSVTDPDTALGSHTWAGVHMCGGNLRICQVCASTGISKCWERFHWLIGEMWEEVTQKEARLFTGGPWLNPEIINWISYKNHAHRNSFSAGVAEASDWFVFQTPISSFTSNTCQGNQTDSFTGYSFIYISLLDMSERFCSSVVTSHVYLSPRSHLSGAEDLILPCMCNVCAWNQ